jgi:hypothetical protein
VTLALLVLLIFSAASPAPAQSSLTPGLLASAEKEAAKESTNNEPAKAQEPEAGPKRTRLQLGVSLKSTVTPGIDTADSVGPTFIWRWRGKGSRTDDRWAPAYRLSSFNSRVSSQLGSRELPVGDVKLQPLMLGIDYKMPRGKWNWAAGMSAGWSMNNVDTPGAYRDRVINTTGIPDLWVDVHNSFVWGPRLKGWYDVNRRVSFMVESAYLVTRPELDVRANGIVTTRRINADALIVKAGVVYGIF